MPKSQRLMELMLTVNRKRKFTARELAEQLGVSVRTIMRDLQELSEIGVPLYAEVGPHGGFRVVKERVLPPIAFTEGEAIAMFFASHALRHYASLPFAAETSAALAKFVAILPADVKDRIEQMKNRVDLVIPPREEKAVFLNQLLDAAVNHTAITIEYDSRTGTTVRDILPIGIYASNGFWYCPAYCYLRKEMRNFRVDYIRSVQLDECHVAETDPGIDLRRLDLSNWQKTDTPAGESVLIEVQLSRTGVRRCQAELWPRPDIELMPDGSGRMFGPVPTREIPFFAGFFLGLGRDAIVRRPTELVQLIRAQISEIAASYAATDG